ncbi:hypothetical protein ACCO45_000554 [Purpureocillium lilacinum]|uniref:Uncharacterized protein n=1 Tax=Purpureocillium lilacinum TaxID=33203 RepID=A0ACC4E4J9_PURLI
MGTISAVATALMAILHVYILVLEMFLWTTPRGRRAFRLTPEFAQQTRALAANQGLYNGFLAAGLVWGLTHPVAEFSAQIRLFFLGCVVVAGRQHRPVEHMIRRLFRWPKLNHGLCCEQMRRCKAHCREAFDCPLHAR